MMPPDTEKITKAIETGFENISTGEFRLREKKKKRKEFSLGTLKMILMIIGTSATTFGLVKSCGMDLAAGSFTTRARFDEKTAELETKIANSTKKAEVELSTAVDSLDTRAQVREDNLSEAFEKRQTKLEQTLDNTTTQNNAAHRDIGQKVDRILFLLVRRPSP